MLVPLDTVTALISEAGGPRKREPGSARQGHHFVKHDAEALNPSIGPSSGPPSDVVTLGGRDALFADPTALRAHYEPGENADVLEFLTCEKCEW